MSDQTDPTTTATTPNPEATTGGDGDLGDAGKRALAAERKARRDAETQAREAQDRLRELERADLVRSVALEKGLTEHQAKFLTGDSAEDITRSADELVQAFTVGDDSDRRRETPKEALRPGASGSAAPGPSYDDIARKLVSGG